MTAISRYRLLLVILSLATVAALWELTDPNPQTSRKSQVLPYVMLDLYPDSPQILYQLGIQQVLQGDLPAARRQFERALAAGETTNEDLLYYYAVTLVRAGASPAEVKQAVARWQFHFPHSRRRLPTDTESNPAKPRPGQATTDGLR
ncbi:MAG: hypothetical protein V4719_28015 [Planctomycetota bacterium]